ncbi:hypothetical protein KP509_12G058000 [Ceratopteris richardii]|nr:hypothetical protein KP509_12G058000 [Ceratopteris richardii]
MAGLQQFQETSYNRGLLPPLREVFFEVQVNELIHEFFFASPEEGLPRPLRTLENGALEHMGDGVLSASRPFSSGAPAQRTASLWECDSPCSERGGSSCEQSTQVGTSIALQTDFDEGNAQPKLIEKKMHEIPYYTQSRKVPNSFGDGASTVKGSSQSKAANTTLCRADSLPSSEKSGLHLSAPCRVNTDAKSGFKKPPLSPKLPNSHAMKSNSTLKRCFSDMGPFPSSLRRSKSEKKASSWQSAALDTSVWALIVTLCFAVIMIGQGLHPSGTRQGAFIDAVAHPANEYQGKL